MKIIYMIFVISTMSNLAYANDCNNINDQAKKLMSQYQITGMSVAIVSQHHVEFCNYGYTNKEKKNKVTEKSIFEIASLTKTFTALLAGIAVATNKLNLSTPITQYLPELSKNKNYTKIDNKELLTHVSGLPLGFDKDFTESELINSAVNMKFTTSPASYYQYSNPGITLSGIALTKIYNTDYQSLLNKLILNQLGMKYTSLNVETKNQDLIVTGYNKHNQPVDFMSIGIENPAGGLKSNTYDLAKYLQLQINSRPSNFSQALEIVHKNYYCLYEAGTYQQLAWEYHPINDLFKKYQPDSNYRNITPPHKLPNNCQNVINGFIDKTGNSPGMTSYIAYVPSSKIGVVILSSGALRPEIVDLGRYVLQKQSSR